MESEAEFLTRQANLIKARLRQSARALGDDLVAPFGIRPFIERRPWWSVGGAAVGGFLCGVGLRRRRQAKLHQRPGKVAKVVSIANRRIGRLVKGLLSGLVAAGLRGPQSVPAKPPAPANGSAAHHKPPPRKPSERVPAT